MKVLGLDMGLKTGWCLHDGKREVMYGTWLIDKDNPKRDRARRLIDFTWNVKDTLDREKPDLVVYENVQFVVSYGQITLWSMFQGIVVLQCAMRGIRCEGVSVGTLKKWATGRGDAKKSDMIQAAIKLLRAGDAILSSDEADAVCLAFYGQEELL